MAAPDLRNSAAVLARQLQAGAIDAVDLAEAALAAIGSCEDQAIFIDVLADRARREAKAARRRLKAGRPASALDGIPIAWKDLFDIAGRATTAGSAVLKNAGPALADADFVANGAAAGLVTLGTTNMTEFAYSGLGLNPYYGTPRNAHGKDAPRIPGGSSSGAAVAAARRLAPISIGTDTGGSIRIPAALNGVVGYKSSTGHYPMRGVFPLSQTLDSLGPFAQTVEDCVLADAVLRGAVLPEAKRAQPKTLRILVPEEAVVSKCDAAVRDNFEASLERMAKAGVIIERLSFLPLSQIEFRKHYGAIVSSEAFCVHRARLAGEDRSKMDQRVAQRMRLAEALLAVDLVDVLVLRQKLIAMSDALLGEALIAYPTVQMTAPEIAPLETAEDAYLAANARVLNNTMLGNFLNWCGVALPNGTDSQGLPTSILISARHGRDTHLLSAALALENLVIP